MKPCFIDVHFHLDLLEDQDKIIENMRENEVGIAITNGVNPISNKKVLDFIFQFKEIRAALGLYPIDALNMTEDEIEEGLSFIKKNKDKIVAIGEVGLDFKEDSMHHQRQIDLFKQFIDLSIKLCKPLLIHTRKAEKEVIEILQEKRGAKVILHCFTGKFSLIKRSIEQGFNFSIPASIKNSEHFQKLVQICPIEQLFCETDSPYLHPDRLYPNEPANVVASYKKIAEIKGITLEDTKSLIFKNYSRIFKEL